MSKKQCTKCNQTKPLSSFYKNWRYKDGYTYHCRSCLLAKGRKRNKEKVKQRTKKSLRISVRRYCESEEEITWWINKAKDGCQICGEEEVVIDHDHETNEIRGWLCNNCNAGLGMFNDSVDLLYGAIEYIR